MKKILLILVTLAVLTAPALAFRGQDWYGSSTNPITAGYYSTIYSNSILPPLTAPNTGFIGASDNAFNAGWMDTVNTNTVREKLMVVGPIKMYGHYVTTNYVLGGGYSDMPYSLTTGQSLTLNTAVLGMYVRNASALYIDSVSIFGRASHSVNDSMQVSASMNPINAMTGTGLATTTTYFHLPTTQGWATYSSRPTSNLLSADSVFYTRILARPGAGDTVFVNYVKYYLRVVY